MPARPTSAARHWPGREAVVADPRRRPRSRGVARARARHPASNTPAAKRPPSPRVRRRRAVLTTVLGALAIVGFLFAFVYPTSTFFRQRSEIGTANERLAQLEAETQRLEAEAEKLRGDAEVERLAREQYGLVRPGETSYVLIPAIPTTTLPPEESTATTP